MNVSREINEFVELLLKWNKKINLISESTIKDIWLRHIEDCLQLLNFIDEENKVIDLGSGAGLPGVILSLSGVKNITLVEADSRKAAFLHIAAKLSNNKINIINDRVENIAALECDILVSRAFANLSKTFSLTQKIAINDKYLLLKGKTIDKEILDAKSNWSFDYNISKSKSNSEGAIVEIFNLEKKYGM